MFISYITFSVQYEEPFILALSEICSITSKAVGDSQLKGVCQILGPFKLILTPPLYLCMSMYLLFTVSCLCRLRQTRGEA